jgi:hypothetical protein
LIEDVAVVELHPLVDVELPSGVIGAMVPVALPPPGVEVVASGVSGIGVIALVLAAAGVVIGPVVAEVEGPVTGGGTGMGGAVTTPRAAMGFGGIVAAVLSTADVEVAATGAGLGVVTAGAAIVPIAVEVAVTEAVIGTIVVVCVGDGMQLMLAPAMVGSSASGTGARVVSGTPDSVAAENGLGPFSGDDTIAPGVDGIPIAVVPIVEICATQALPPSSKAVIAHRKIRMSPVPASLSAPPAAFAARPCCRRPD